MALHEIVRRSPGVNIGRGTYAVAASRGIALGFTDQNTLELMQGTGSFAGFLTRPVVVGGPTLADHVFPGRIELPFTAGEEVSVEKGEAVEAEGADYMIVSGTGALSSSSTVGTPISFKDGKMYEAQSGDIAYFTLADPGLDPEVAGNLRCRFEAI